MLGYLSDDSTPETEVGKDVVAALMWTNGGAEYTRSVDSKN